MHHGAATSAIASILSVHRSARHTPLIPNARQLRLKPIRSTHPLASPELIEPLLRVLSPSLLLQPFLLLLLPLQPLSFFSRTPPAILGILFDQSKRYAGWASVTEPCYSAVTSLYLDMYPFRLPPRIPSRNAASSFLSFARQSAPCRPCRANQTPFLSADVAQRVEHHEKLLMRFDRAHQTSYMPTNDRRSEEHVSSIRPR